MDMDTIRRVIEHDERIDRAFPFQWRLTASCKAHAVRMATRKRYRLSIDEAVTYAIQRVRDEMARYDHETGCMNPYERHLAEY